MPQPDLDALVALFYEDAKLLGGCKEAAFDDLPTDHQRLLYHQEHMTVAMEAYHESLVSVDVLATRLTDTHYARKILLRRQSDNVVVQFGIMRINLECIGDDVRAEIESQQRPLGRILVRHNALRMIRLDRLWHVTPGDDLRELFSLGDAATTYGRTAGIDLNGTPAVEVLEIVAPM
jgi:chorismate-pyruvate lyase